MINNIFKEIPESLDLIFDSILYRIFKETVYHFKYDKGMERVLVGQFINKMEKSSEEHHEDN